jgi:hypothetical protein
MRFLYIGIIFYIASVIIVRYELNSQDVFTGVYIVFVGAIGSGAALA